MTTINRFTKEQLIASAREKVKSLEFTVTQTAFAENRAELEEELELARIALASLEAEPVAYLNATDIKNSEDHILAKRLRSHACTMPVYTATPAPVVPDANGCLPCPFCNSPVKWCGENSADPDDDHICHHIQCTNPECGADFDFINTGDDLLPDDPAVLDAMTSAELVQPLREVCKGRFNLRAAMLQGSQPVNNRDELPLDYLQGHKDGLEWAAQLAEANHPQTGGWLYDDPTELAKAIRKGPDMPPVESGNSPVIPDWQAEAEKMSELHGSSFVVFRNGESPQCADPSKVIISFTDKGLGHESAAPKQEKKQ
ncbi:Lar family restriction alleviation protein [Salmonella enterica]|uniref:Lar family restriction alleviation protein n=1 Tax=Salmonella enterica TaxID=28901 RepID=UPI001E52DCD2|nr:Lar family restriction alleviation protein [Salmonella enterica]